MDGIENAMHDISDATLSVETAIELLTSMHRDGTQNQNLEEVISNLLHLRGGLEETYRKLSQTDGDQR